MEPFGMLFKFGLRYPRGSPTRMPRRSVPPTVRITCMSSPVLHKFVLNLGSAFCDIRVHTSVTAPYGGATTEVCAEVPGAVPPFSITDQHATSVMSGP
ncbi:hypothetical protein B0H12DRAFT_1140446 [Mycena haematopus]|nr:hypothetical protein B0H12DRAFT_1140446 [Mycena haematopus]